MPPNVRILIVEKEGLLRDGLSAVLGQEAPLQVVGITSPHAVADLVSIPTVDAVILGPAALERVPEEVCAGIRRRWATAKIVLLAFTGGAKTVATAIQAGADAYLLVTDTQQELTTAIASVMEGGHYVSPAAGAGYPSGLGGEAIPGAHSHDDGLSEREREVVRQIARGLRTREIAIKLSLSQKTIEKHRSNVMRKLGLRSATAVAAYAIANGYLQR